MPSNRAVCAAIGANVMVATATFVAAAFTGSSSMLAEGIHSTVDAGNDGLLLVGRKAREREPDETHPFGYGKEEYFWTLIVAMFIFALGGGVSAHEGDSRLLEPGSIENPIWSYFLSQLLGNTYPDDIASLLIGLIMASTAVLLMYESKKLLIGETADRDMIEGIRAIAEADEAVTHCGPPLTMHLGPEDVLLNLDIPFKDDLSADEIFGAIDRLEYAIREKFTEVRRIFIEAERLRRKD
jgi:divalent metal cation (Fe/Co/Zn/Cd) transporter